MNWMPQLCSLDVGFLSSRKLSSYLDNGFDFAGLYTETDKLSHARLRHNYGCIEAHSPHLSQLDD